MGGDFLFFFLFKWGEKEKQKVNRWCVSKSRDCCSAHSLCHQCCLIKWDWEPVPAGRSCWWYLVFLFCFVGSGILLWRVQFPWFSCLLLCFNAFGAGKKDVFAFKVRTKRKESFVNEINVKSRMCSLGVKSKSRHHS